MVVVDERIAQFVLLVADVDDGVRRLRSLRNIEPLGHRTRNDVTHDHLQREDGHAPAELVAVVELFDEMRGDSVLDQILEDNGRYLVVEQALRLDRRFLDVVVCRSIVLVVDDDHIGVVRQEYLFCLALVEHFALFHSRIGMIYRFYFMFSLMLPVRRTELLSIIAAS